MSGKPEPKSRTQKSNERRHREPIERDKRNAGKKRDEKSEDDIVDEASEESFPASDPPSWTPTHAGKPS